MKQETHVLICVDYKDGLGNWSKEWATLCPRSDLVVLEASQVLSHPLIGRCGLMLIHNSTFPNDNKLVEFVRQVFGKSTDVCVAVVAHGGLSPRIAEGARLQYVRTAFPNGGDLSFLENRVARLVAELAKARNASIADRQVAFQKAWDAFDHSDDHSVLVALAILSQGYLVARGRINMLVEGAGRTLPVSAPNSQRIARAVTEPSWWLNPFDGINLKLAVAEEWGGPVPGEVVSLLDKLEARIELGPQDDKTVANVLQEVRNILER
jgi:hypothetical protein